MDKNKLFQDLFKQWKLANQSLSAKTNQGNCVTFWNENKANSEAILIKILELKSKAMKSKGHLLGLLSQQKPNTQECALAPEITSLENQHSQRDEAKVVQPLRVTPSQDAVSSQISKCNDDIISLMQVKSSGFATSQQIDILKSKKKLKYTLEKKLKRLKEDSQRQKSLRERKKKNMQKVISSHPELGPELKSLCTRPSAGKPRIEESQPLLLKTIVDIVSSVCGADGRRRTENLRCCTTLDDLHLELQNEGFSLSRSALYLRLLPRNRLTNEGKRHVTTAPVKLIKSPNDDRKKHDDSHFASATIKYLRNLAELMGPEVTFVCSQDDKAKVPLGKVAANCQAPILMNMEYKIRLPDHDFVVAPRHKFIPSVYAGLCFDKNEKLGYSGPTFIAIRSLKHDKSSAQSHSRDFKRLMELPHFKENAKQSDGAIKPIVVLFVDGGPDENPRYNAVVNEAISNFKEYNLDAFFIATQAPGLSAYNPVERRMAPLSKDLAGLVLRHDHFGTHLDSQAKTIDVDLEKRNFQKAGELLASIWSQTIIDGHEVYAEFVCNNEEITATENTELWKNAHVVQSQYLLQIVKCDNQTCCAQMRTNLKLILHNGFIPPPIPFKKTIFGISSCDFNHKEDGSFGDLFSRITLEKLAPTMVEFPVLPFHLFCPSLKNVLKERMCSKCFKYFPSKKACITHANKLHPLVFSTTESIIQSIKRVAVNEDYDGGMPIIENLTEWLSSPFEELEN